MSKAPSKRGKRITLAEAATIATQIRESIEKRRIETNDIEHARSEVAELEIAYDRCGCAECLESFERAQRTLTRLVEHWYGVNQNEPLP